MLLWLPQDNFDFAAGKIIFRDRWHHVAGVFNGSALQVFVDGVPGSRTFVEGRGLDHDGYLSIGGAEWDPFWGELDELQVWDRPLSAAEIFGLMEQQATGNEEGLKGYWRMDEGEGGLVRDMTRFGNHAHLGRGRRSACYLPSPGGLCTPLPLVVLYVCLPFLHLTPSRPPSTHALTPSHNRHPHRYHHHRHHHNYHYHVVIIIIIFFFFFFFIIISSFFFFLFFFSFS